MELSEIHDCEKCRGKIVAIQMDKFTGLTKCGYCHQVVDYKSYFKEKLKDDKTFQDFLKEKMLCQKK